MKIIETDGNDTLMNSVRFIDIPCCDKFATIANGRLTVWRKMKDTLDYLVGQDPSCEYTCPQPNAITDSGFPACFSASDEVFKVNSSEYNDRVILDSLKARFRDE
jgi:hypothetical protein